jgi:hypothetical protein
MVEDKKAREAWADWLIELHEREQWRRKNDINGRRIRTKK